MHQAGPADQVLGLAAQPGQARGLPRQVGDAP